ncbi:MAG TPA: hypothetical protein VL100_10930 [Croceibacterium sp.]|nr:hypothetical protein [Croceibacterium sp.]
MFEGDVAFATGNGCNTQAEAEAEGIVWAQEHVVRVLYMQCEAEVITSR